MIINFKKYLKITTKIRFDKKTDVISLCLLYRFSNFTSVLFQHSSPLLYYLQLHHVETMTAQNCRNTSFTPKIASHT